MAVKEDDKAVKHGRERVQGTRNAESVAIAIRAITSISTSTHYHHLPGLDLHNAHPSYCAVSGTSLAMVSDLPHTDLRNQYRTGKTLGSGTYAIVKEAVHIKTGKYYACKVINKKLMEGREFMVRVRVLGLTDLVLISGATGAQRDRRSKEGLEWTSEYRNSTRLLRGACHSLLRVLASNRGSLSS